MNSDRLIQNRPYIFVSKYILVLKGSTKEYTSNHLFLVACIPPTTSVTVETALRRGRQRCVTPCVSECMISDKRTSLLSFRRTSNKEALARDTIRYCTVVVLNCRRKVLPL